MYAPSVYAHIVGGLLVLFAFVLILAIYTQYTNMTRDTYKILMLLLMFSIATSVHGLSHLGLEVAYGYNPMRSFMNPV